MHLSTKLLTSLLVCFSLSGCMAVGYAPVDASLCEQGYMPSCEYTLDHLEDNKNWKELLPLATKLCNENYGIACGHLASYYWWEKPNNRKALQYAKKGASNEDRLSNLILAEAYYSGIYYRKNYKKAMQHADKACNASTYYYYACYMMADMYNRGLGVSSNKKYATEYAIKSCPDNADGCMIAARNYEKGRGVSQSYITARSYYDKACSKGNDNGCSKVAYIDNNNLTHQEEVALAQAQAERANRVGNAMGNTMRTLQQMQQNNINHAASMANLYRSTPTYTFSPMSAPGANVNVYRYQRLNDNMGMIQQVR